MKTKHFHGFYQFRVSARKFILCLTRQKIVKHYEKFVKIWNSVCNGQYLQTLLDLFSSYYDFPALKQKLHNLISVLRRNLILKAEKNHLKLKQYCKQWILGHFVYHFSDKLTYVRRLTYCHMKCTIVALIEKISSMVESIDHTDCSTQTEAVSNPTQGRN